MLFNKKTSKFVAAITLLLMIGFQSLDAMARVGGGSRSSGFSSSRSYSNSSASPSRAGAGSNTGMQRNNVVNNERQNSQANQQAQPNQQTSQQAAPQQSSAQPATPGKFGLGTVAGAAVAGAAAGYLLNSHNNNQTAGNGNGASGQYGEPANGQPANSQSASSGFPWGSIFMLLIAGFGLVWLYKRSKGFKTVGATMKEVLNPQSMPTSTPTNSNNSFNAPNYNSPSFNGENQAFEAEALKFFIALQEANNRGDIKFMQNYSVGEMQQALISDIQNRTSASGSLFSLLAAKVIDMTTENNQQIASVRFTGMAGEINSPLEPLDEVWHLVRETGEWQLAGIEQV